MELKILICVNVVLIVFAQQAACYTISGGQNYYRYCSPGNYLRITSARWYCSNNSLTVTSLVNSKCNYNTACTLYATNSWLGGDPCPGDVKYLEWSDSCNSIWGSWGSWSACPGDCTTNNLVRHRPCVKPNGGCGSPPTDYIASSSEISRSTPDDQVYYSLTTDCFVATDRTSVAFRARANNDLHIALGSVDSIISGTHYEFIIGGWNNTRSEIRFALSSRTCDSYSGSVLSQTYFDEFWISWIGNYIRFGTGSTPGSNIRMSCYLSTPYDVNFIWIKTGWGSSGEWRFSNDVACKHVTNSNVSIITDDTSCNGTSSYACNSGYKQVAGNTQRTCGFGGILSGYPLVCSVESGTNNTRAEDEQSPFLVPILSGSAVVIVVIIFAIILGNILRRHLSQQQVNRSAYQEHRAPIPNKSEDHYTELDLTEAHQYIELDSVQADISTVTGQFASTSDNQYTEPHTINQQLDIDKASLTPDQQLDIDKASLTPDHPYTALDTIQNTQTTNIPSGMQ